MSFIFYDTETTGKRLGFDQILQFGAILTDENLETIDTFSIRGQLLPHIVPSPSALLVNGANIADLTEAPLSHFGMMRRVCAKMNEWSAGSTIFIGWNSLRFDENMLRQAYYQTLLPIYQTNTRGNGRADLMRIVQVLTACRPNTVSVPITAEGKRTFQLGMVAQANAIVLDCAHEALNDARATVNLAKLVKQRSPDLWDAMLANARKVAPLQMMRSQELLFLSETFGGTPYNLIVAPIAANAINANEWAVFDLQFDPITLLDQREDRVREAITGSTKIIRRVSINAQPSLLPLDFAPENIRGGRLSIETYQARANAIRNRPEFAQRVSRVLMDRYASKERSIYVEEQIYDGFTSPADQARLNDFHHHDWQRRADMIETLEDDRLRELGDRLVAVERTDLLTDQKRQYWKTWHRDRLVTAGKVPWLTVFAAREEIAELREDASRKQHQQLDEIERFIAYLASPPPRKIDCCSVWNTSHHARQGHLDPSNRIQA